MAKTRPPYKPEFRPLSSVTAAARPACAPRWARLATPTTMRCARASSPRWNASFSTGLGSRRRPRRGSVFEFVEALDHNRRRRHSSIGYLSPIDYKLRHAANPDAHQPATVLASVKDKPFGRPPTGAVLDRRCARRPHHRAGRDERMAPPGAEQKNDTRQESKMPSDQIP
jgi:hypothetical protein